MSIIVFLADKAGDDKVDDDVHGQGNLVHLEAYLIFVISITDI